MDTPDIHEALTKHCAFAYCDGACSGNPGPGSFGVVLVALKADGTEHTREISGLIPEHTTNNQAELHAILAALRAIKKPCELTIFSDSKNAVGWITGAYKAHKAEISALVSEIHQEATRRQVNLSAQHIKGHSGITHNERADQLAHACL